MSRCRAYSFRIHPSGLASALAGELSLIKPGFPCMSPCRGAHLFVKELTNPRPKDSTLENLRA